MIAVSAISTMSARHMIQRNVYESKIQRVSQCKRRREGKQEGRKQLWSRKERRKITKKEKRAQKGFSCSFFSSLGPRLET